MVTDAIEIRALAANYIDHVLIGFSFSDMASPCSVTAITEIDGKFTLDKKFITLV